MGRIRTIKPEFHAHEDLSSLPAETHLLAAALVNYADDEGYFNAHPVLIKAGTNPLRKDKTPIEEQIAQLEKIGYVEIVRAKGKCLGRITTFAEHQRVSHAAPSKIASKFESLRSSSGEPPEPLRPELNRTELKGTGNREGAEAPFVSPDWVSKEAWKGYEEMRAKIRKPLTDRARSLAVAELERLRVKGQDPNAVLNQSTMNSWQGLFEVKGNGTYGNKTRSERNQDALRVLEAEDGCKPDAGGVGGSSSGYRDTGDAEGLQQGSGGPRPAGRPGGHLGIVLEATP